MFENPRRGRQARNFTTNVPKILDLKSSSEQIFSRKLSLGAPVVSLKSHIRLSFSGLKCKRVRLVGVIKPVNIFTQYRGYRQRQIWMVLLHVLTGYQAISYSNTEVDQIRRSFLHDITIIQWNWAVHELIAQGDPMNHLCGNLFGSLL